MKKILFVIENFNVGGIQKSLVNLIANEYKEYEIDVFAFDPRGKYWDSIKDKVTLLNPPRHYYTFARPRKSLGSPVYLTYKLVYGALCRLRNKGFAFKILSPFFRIEKSYDAAIAYSHSCQYKSVNGICPEFVLKKTKANCKICFIHCDYENSGFRSGYNDALYEKFDKIACCSESVKQRFIKFNKSIEDKSYTVRNFYDLRLKDVVKQVIPVQENSVNIFVVARLSKEKGIDRAITALFQTGRKDISYYIIGDGPMKDELTELTKKCNLVEQVVLMGEISEPYSLLLNADYLLVSSYNEAAPIVFDEAHMLGIPIISTDTTSAKEMLGKNDILCSNSTEGIWKVISSIRKPQRKESMVLGNNDYQREQLHQLIYCHSGNVND